MTEEVKSHFDDAKDFSHQIQLESKIKGRNLKDEALKKAVDVTGHDLTTSEMLQGAKMVGTDKLHNLEDKAKQAGYEAQIRGRDAKVELDKSSTKKSFDATMDRLNDKLIDAKDSIHDTIVPSRPRVIESTSINGVDTTSIENDPATTRDLEKERYRAAREEERIQEAKRQELVDSTKAKAAEVKQSLNTALNKAEVILGQAALAVKDKLDEYTNEGSTSSSTTKITPRVSDSGVDTTSIQNPRNEELSKRDERVNEILKENEPSFIDKTKTSLSNAVDKIKSSSTRAKSEPIYESKVSEKGIDISHGENSMNRQLAAKDELRLKEEKDRELNVEKAKIQAHLIEPESESLKTKMSQLGDSISQAAKKLSSEVKEKVEEMKQPVPKVNEKMSESGVDVTSIQNPRNEELGEQMRSKNSDVPSSSQRVENLHANESLKDKTIRKTLDAGVALKETSEQMGDKLSNLKESVAPTTASGSTLTAIPVSTGTATVPAVGRITEAGTNEPVKSTMHDKEPNKLSQIHHAGVKYPTVKEPTITTTTTKVTKTTHEPKKQSQIRRKTVHYPATVTEPTTSTTAIVETTTTTTENDATSAPPSTAKEKLRHAASVTKDALTEAAVATKNFALAVADGTYNMAREAGIATKQVAGDTVDHLKAAKEESTLGEDMKAAAHRASVSTKQSAHDFNVASKEVAHEAKLAAIGGAHEINEGAKRLAPVTRQVIKQVASDAKDGAVVVGNATKSAAHKASAKSKKVMNDMKPTMNAIGTKTKEVASETARITKNVADAAFGATSAMAHEAGVATKQVAHDANVQAHKAASESTLGEDMKAAALRANVNTRQAAHDFSVSSKEVAHEAKLAAKGGAHEINEGAKRLAPVTGQVIKEVAREVREGAGVVAHGMSDAGHSVSQATQRLAQEITSESERNKQSASSSSSTTQDKPGFARVKTLPVVATASPASPDTYLTFSAKSTTTAAPQPLVNNSSLSTTSTSTMAPGGAAPSSSSLPPLVPEAEPRKLGSEHATFDKEL